MPRLFLKSTSKVLEQLRFPISTLSNMPIATSTRPKVAVVGSGVVGMTCALELSEHADVTIVARNMPGDPPSTAWASPWAGAMWFGVDGSTPAQMAMQKKSFEKLWELSETDPESSVTKMDVYDYQEAHKEVDENGLWYSFMPNFRVLEPSEVRPKIGTGMFYTSVVITPDRYLPWIQQKCLDAGIKFHRAEVSSLSEAAKMVPCDVVVNASGNGAKYLSDVLDDKCVQVRGQVMLVKCAAKEVHIRHALSWKDYTYVLPRGDGTTIMGGIKEFGNIDPIPSEWLRKSIHERCHKLMPEVVPEKFEDLEIIRDQVGIRPEREGGVRVEKEVLSGGLKVVHAYGLLGGGYVYSWGMSAAVAKLAKSFLNESELSNGIEKL